MSLNREFLALGLALVLSLTFLGLPEGQKNTIAGICRWGGVVFGQVLFSRIEDFAVNQQKTHFLLSQNVEFALANMGLKEATRENQRLRQALKYHQEEQAQYKVLAEVIGRDPDQIFDTVVINVGLSRGLEQEWPVVNADGLVGHIVQVDEHSAVVQLITRAGLGISSVVQERRTHGVVRWEDGRFSLNYVEADNEVYEGDKVITSGLGGRFPKGITIGNVVTVRKGTRQNLFKDIKLVSNVDFGDLEEVFVLRPSVEPP
jgi:rod shape-determining protein MreC